MEADPFDIVFILAVGDERWSAYVLAPHVKKVACHSGKEARMLCATSTDSLGPKTPTHLLKIFN